MISNLLKLQEPCIIMTRSRFYCQLNKYLTTVGSDNLVFILVNDDDCGSIYAMTPKERQVSTLRQNPYNLNVPCVYDSKVTSVPVAGASMKWRLLKLKYKQTEKGRSSFLSLPRWAQESTSLLHQYQAKKHNLYLLLMEIYVALFDGNKWRTNNRLTSLKICSSCAQYSCFAPHHVR